MPGAVRSSGAARYTTTNLAAGDPVAPPKADYRVAADAVNVTDPVVPASARGAGRRNGRGAKTARPWPTRSLSGIPYDLWLSSGQHRMM